MTIAQIAAALDDETLSTGVASMTMGEAAAFRAKRHGARTAWIERMLR
jgi:hypothetical protein